MEGDLVSNYELMKDYLWSCGHITPLPHQVHHEVARFSIIRHEQIREKQTEHNATIINLNLP